jgi:murein L,D-transpeptidase YafK
MSHRLKTLLVFSAVLGTPCLVLLGAHQISLRQDDSRAGLTDSVGEVILLSQDARADRVVIEKAERRLSLYSDGELLKSYRVALGPNPEGHKQEEGDGRTPEGVYAIDFRKEDSSFHRALHVSYPSIEDRRRAEERGVSPGGDIMIHGLPNGLGDEGRRRLVRDWTEGCVAVLNWEIEEIWRVVPDGTPVEILP